MEYQKGIFSQVVLDDVRSEVTVLVLFFYYHYKWTIFPTDVFLKSEKDGIFNADMATIFHNIIISHWLPNCLDNYRVVSQVQMSY